MKYTVLGIAAAALGLLPAQAQKRPVEWPIYGGTPDNSRYSPLKQINRANVAQLEVAWQYDPGATGGSQVCPIVVEGTLYSTTPNAKLVALDAASGKLKWSWDVPGATRMPVRGVTFWGAGNEARIFAGIGRYVYALNAKTGQVVPGFGKEGRIDLHQDLGRDPERQSVSLTTPGVIYKDLLIVGGRNGESLPASPGDVRAYDVRTGALRWSFHTIPHPGEFGYDTWPTDAWTYSGAANSWAGMTVDHKRGIVFVPTGSAADDFYGANRTGDNLFANSLVALNAETGKRIWHFQAVKHDIWDRDLDSPPTLVTVKRDGKNVDAVAQTSKHAALFLFERETGKPLFPIEYRKFPASDVEGEVAAETQPLPVKPAPFARQVLTEDMLTNRTPEAHQWALDKFRTFRSGGQFVPFSIGKDTVIFPGYDGGAEFGGSAFDSDSGLLYVNANDLAWTGALALNTRGANAGRQIYLAQCASCHGADRMGTGSGPTLAGVGTRKTAEQITAIVQQGSGRMPAFSSLTPDQRRAVVQYVSAVNRPADAPPAAPLPTDIKYRFTGYNKFLDPEGYPAVAPPWGTLNAINLNTGEYAWKIPLGEYPEFAAKGMKDTGTENYGGPVVTAGGLVFIAATNFDRKLRAFDKSNGKLLWETTMVNSGNTTPAIYEVNGRQFVVVAAFGGKGRPGQSGGAIVAYALPQRGNR